MHGRIRKKLLLQKPDFPRSSEVIVCPLCQRPIPDSEKDAHHLVPKSKGGRRTEFLHRVCHRQIHALLTETELAKEFNNVDALLAHPGIARFVDWVRNKPNNFYERTQKSQRIRKT